MANINTQLLDATTRHQIYLERYAGGLANKILKLLIKSESAAREIFDARLTRIQSLGYDQGPKTSERTEELITDLGAAIESLRQKEAFGPIADELAEELDQFAEYEAAFIVRTNNEIMEDALDGTPFAISFQSAAPAQVYAAAMAKPFNISHNQAARTIAQYINGMAASERARIEDAVRVGVVNGATTRDIVRSVWGTIENRKNQDGNAAVIKTRRGAEALVRTAVNHVSSVARDETYKQNADLVKGVRWVSTMDSRISAICARRDGEVYPVDSGPRPPAHPNCRSSTAPELKTFRDLGIDLDEPEKSTRAYFAIPEKMNVTQYRKKLAKEGLTKSQQDKIIRSLSGQTEDTDFGSFLGRQTKAFQETVLGVERTKLYREGGLSLKDLISPRGEYYTLSELKSKHPSAFEKVE